MTIISAKMALAKLTNDSIASDSSPTEPVMYQARVLSVMVMMATPTDAHSSRRGVRNLAASMIPASTQGDPGELALAHLQYIGASTQLEALVADDSAIHPHAATLNQPVAFAAGSGQPSLFEQGGDA